GEKTQKNVQDAIEFKLKNQGSRLFAQIEPYAKQVTEKLKKAFPNEKMELTGEFLRELEVINKLEFVTTVSQTELIDFLILESFEIVSELANEVIFSSPESVQFQFHLVDHDVFEERHFATSSSVEFLQRSLEIRNKDESQTRIHLKIPNFLREDPSIFERDFSSAVITVQDIRGIIHCHSDWSDGSSSIPELAEACIQKGLEYLVMSDHSKTAFYAKGLSEERVLAQQEFIDELNKKYAPFKIFKSIESDILNDGSLDYSNEILSRFDLVIASVHSNLKMTEQKAMARLIAAIENPYTTILGHMTGRLLLSRKGYPIDHKKIIDACAANKVVIELNAHPRRLDMDWRWIPYALDKGVIISIDPDAHYISGFEDLRFGVMAARKGGLTKESNLSSFSAIEFETYLSHLHKH
ncbi:MAG: PHP domain-containing protein, partial [Chitinophagaceae bacterium]